jgi:hypothetical protein
MTSVLTTVTATSALNIETPTKETLETVETDVGEDRRDYGTNEVDQCWSVVAGMGHWWSEVGAGVEQGR